MSQEGGTSFPAAHVSFRLKASSSGARGAHDCQASMTASSIRIAPRQVEVRHGRFPDCFQNQRGDDAEAAPPGTAQSPEEILMNSFIAVDDATVRQDDLRSNQMIRGHAVHAPENPKAPAQRVTGDPNPRATTRGNGEPVVLQGVVNVAEAPAATDHGHVARDRD